MSKNLSTKYYQENKESLLKKASKKYKNLSKKKKEKKKENMAVNVKKSLRRWKTKTG